MEKRKIKTMYPTGTDGLCGRCERTIALVENPRGPEPRCMGCLEQDDRERTHGLKTASRPYQDVVAGRKKFEYRIDDRDFQVGDLLQLRELVDDSDTVDPTHYTYEKPVRYTGEVHVVRVTHILRGPDAEQYGIAKGYAVLSIEDAYMETGRPENQTRVMTDVMAALFRNGIPTDSQLLTLMRMPARILFNQGRTVEEIRGFADRAAVSGIMQESGATLTGDPEGEPPPGGVA